MKHNKREPARHQSDRQISGNRNPEDGGGAAGKRYCTTLLLFALVPLFAFLFYSCGTETTPTYSLTVNASPEEGGEVTPSGGAYDEGTQVELDVIPAENWVFAGWEGDLTGTDYPATITMTRDMNVTALFTLREYELSLEIRGEGRVREEVVEDPARSEYDHGTTVRLTAEPDDGWIFTGWEGDLEGRENPQTIVIDDAKSVTAVFEPLEQLLEIETEGEGEVQTETDSSDVRLTAVPADGWRFAGWGGDLDGDENPATITIEGNTSIKAVFEQITIAVNVTVNGEGTVSFDPDQDAWYWGDELTLTAEPAEGHRFTGWSGDLSGSDPEVTIPAMEEDMDITAEFVPITHPMWAMGYNHNGQLGDGTTTDRKTPIQGATGFFDVEEVAAGGFHSLILQMDGQLLAMGYNGQGQLGDGSTADRHSPVPVTDGVTAIAAGEQHSLFLKNSTLWTMGGNEYGQLGDGSATNRPDPVEVQSNVVAIAAGDRHSLFITSGGELWGMGNSSRGQLGFISDGNDENGENGENGEDGEDENGDPEEPGEPELVPNPDPVRIDHPEEIVAIAAGGSHTLFIDATGTLYGLGSNFLGQLGNDTRTIFTEPVEIAQNVERVEAGRDHTLYVTTGGDLYATGSNERGKLGNGETTGNQYEPVQVASGVDLIAAGLHHSLFIRNDGTLWGMGENATRGQLGDDSGADKLTPEQIDENVIRVAAGVRHTLFVKVQ